MKTALVFIALLFIQPLLARDTKPKKKAKIIKTKEVKGKFKSTGTTGEVEYC